MIDRQFGVQKWFMIVGQFDVIIQIKSCTIIPHRVSKSLVPRGIENEIKWKVVDTLWS